MALPERAKGSIAPKNSLEYTTWGEKKIGKWICGMLHVCKGSSEKPCVGLLTGYCKELGYLTLERVTDLKISAASTRHMAQEELLRLQFSS